MLLNNSIPVYYINGCIAKVFVFAQGLLNSEQPASFKESGARKKPKPAHKVASFKCN
jgi:hypothetical protein